MKILIIGRGPSAYKKKVNESEYDLIVKLKICNCDDPNVSNRCDILVLYANELFTDGQNYDVDRHIDKIKYILYFNPFDKPSRTMNHVKTHGTELRVMSNEYLKRQSECYGFKYNESPRIQTGAATILHFLNKYPKATISLLGFDNMVNNVKLGEFDNISALPSDAHDIPKEHEMLKLLLKKYPNLVIYKH